ncbi:MAG: type II toxin-antitoxin system VapB family antitoxin [Rhizobiaceae bacterium]|nr:type II toxin-antitoxin system VapB family antitoxin [Rhizobiaceae bacterium]
MSSPVDVDDGLLAEAIASTGFHTGKAVVEEALRRLIADNSRRRAISETAGIGWEGDLDAMREGRDADGRP